MFQVNRAVAKKEKKKKIETTKDQNILIMITMHASKSHIKLYFTAVSRIKITEKCENSHSVNEIDIYACRCFSCARNSKCKSYALIFWIRICICVIMYVYSRLESNVS